MIEEKPKQFQQNQILKLKSNKIVRKTFKNLIYRLLHQFRSQSYDVNSILFEERANLTALKQKSLKPQKLDKQANNEQSNKNLEKQKSEIEDLEKIWVQISIFIWQLGYSPKCYVEMFENEEIHAEESEVIDMHIFTSKIYKRVMSKCKNYTELTPLFEEIAADQIYFFLEQVSSQICINFSECRKIIFKQLQQTTEIIQKSKIINFYVLFKVFKDLAAKCLDMISSILIQGIFRNVEPDVISRFAHYILQKYQILEMEMKKQNLKDMKELTLEKKKSIVDQLMGSNSIKWRQAIGEDGEIGILIEIQDQKQQQDTPSAKNYIVMLDEEGQIKVMHCNSLYKKWKVCKKAQKNYDIVNLVKNQKALAARLRGIQAKQHAYKMTMIDNVGLFGGTMGRTLAQIDKFDNAGEFIATLSQRMVIGGSLNYMVSTVPLLGYIFITGGYTYSFYYIFSNKYSNKNKKLRQLRNMTLGLAGSVGSGLVGATIGQTLIPVPILGAFIGGLVGGFIGQLGGRTISEILETHKFKVTIQELNNTIQPQGYWPVNKRTLKILQINKDKFYETIPQGVQNKMNCDRIWITLIFFTLIAFSQSEKRVKFLSKKLKQMKKRQKFQIISDDSDMEGQIQGQDEYQPSLNLLTIMHFFQENHIYYLDYHDNIAHIMQKMFSRLK